MPIEFLDEGPKSSGKIEFLDAPPKGGISFLEGPGEKPSIDDVKRLVSAPGSTYEPSFEEYQAIQEAEAKRPLTEKAGALVGTAFKTAAGLLPEIYQSGKRTLGELTELEKSRLPVGEKFKRAGATVAEGAAQGLYGLGSAFRAPYDFLERKALDYLSGGFPKTTQEATLRALQVGLGQHQAPEAEQFAYQQYLDKLKRERVQEKLAAGSETFVPALRGAALPATSQFLGEYVFDPTNLVPGATPAAKVGRGVASKVAEKAAEVAQKTGEVTSKVAKLPVTLAEKALEKAVPDESTRKVLAGAGVSGGAIGGAMAGAVAPAAALGTAFAVGKGLEKAGEFGKALARTVGDSSLSRLKQVAMSGDAPQWVQGAARALDRIGAGKALGAAEQLGKSAAGGALVMAPAVVGTESPEEAGQVLGSGAGMATAAHVALAPFAIPAHRRAAEDLDILRWYGARTPEEQAGLSGISRDDALRALTAEWIANGVSKDRNVRFTYLPEDKFNQSYGDTRGVAFVNAQDGKPTLVFNLGRMRSRTIGHELFHALSKMPGTVDTGRLYGQLLDVTNAQGNVVRQGLLSRPEFDRLTDLYISQLPEAQRASFAPLPNESTEQHRARVDARILEEIGADLFANLFDDSPGNVLRHATSTTRRLLDAALLSERYSWLNRLGEKLEGIFGQAPTAQSDIFRGLKGTPQLQAILRDFVRAKDRVTTPEIDTEAAPSVAFPASEFVKPGNEKLVEMFADSDMFAKDANGNVALDPGRRPILLTEREMKRVQANRAAQMENALVVVPDTGETGAVRLKDNGAWEGDFFTDAQLAALMQLPNEVLTPSMKAKLKEINGQLKQRGQPLLLHYNAALRKGRYSSGISEAVRVAVPLSVHISKAHNFYITTLDLTHFWSKWNDWKANKPRAFDVFGGPESFLQKVQQYLGNHEAGQPGAAGLDADPAKAKAMADRIVDFFNIRDLSTEGIIPERLSGRREKDNLVRSRRFDRINRVEPASGDRFPVEYNLIKRAFAPGVWETVKRPGATQQTEAEYAAWKERVGARYSPDVETKQGRKEPNEEVRQQAEGYMAQTGLPYRPHAVNTPVNEALAREIADWYQQAPHEPENPAVRAAYDNFSKETVDQWNYITAHGVVMEPWTKEGQPYKNSAEMTEDVRKNKHLWFFPTDQGFGTGGGTQVHPLLAPSGVKAGGRQLLVNDVFRAVHDYFGHAKEGYEFGPRGETNAYLAHSSMYSDAAKPAMAAETLGQNSWVNFGAHLRRPDGTIPKKGEEGFVPAPERPFAEQKATLLPAEFIKSAQGQVVNSQQFSPNTDAGKKLEQEGFRFERTDYGTGGHWEITVYDDAGEDIASIDATRSGDKSAHIGLVIVASRQRRRGIGEALYRELATALQKDGITELSGDLMMGQAPNRLRTKIFGEGEKGAGVLSSRVRSRIEPDMKFSPLPKGDKREGVDKPAVRMPDGQIFTGTWHGDAVEAAEKTGVYSSEDFERISDGFLTTHGRFLNREQAYKLATKAGQITEKNYAKNEPDSTLFREHPELETGAFEETRRFSPSPAPTFYSQLEKTVGEKFQGKQMPAAQLAAILRNPQNGIKAEELKWSGIDDFLRDKQRVTKEEVQQYLAANRVEVKEVVKGAGQPEIRSAVRINRDIDAVVNELRSRGASYAPTDKDWEAHPDLNEKFTRLSEELDAAHAAEAGDYGPKFSQYQLPGGENYRELLLTLPERQAKELEELPPGYTVQERPEARRRPGALWEVRSPTGAFVTAPDKEGAIQIALNLLNADRKKDARANQFKSGHSDEPNVLAHVRFNERTDASGKRVLFLEEVQSDWHQKGRKEGYANDARATELKKLSSRRALTLEEVDELNRLHDARGIPDAPFKNTWHELVLRRMVRWAAENGFDAVAWTTGEQQAERYDLSKHIKELYWETPARTGLDGPGKLIAVDLNGNEAINRQTTPDKLPDFVGKEAAEKLLQASGRVGRRSAVYVRKLSGVDLKVGGEGMKGFYDKILVDYANKFGKKFGARVEKTNVPQQHDASRAELFTSDRRALDVLERGGTLYVLFPGVAGEHLVRNTKELEKLSEEFDFKPPTGYYLGDDQPPTLVHSLPITPAMKQTVLEQGQPLFSPTPEQALKWGKRIVALHKTNGTGSTFNPATNKSLGKSNVFMVSIFPDLTEKLEPAEFTPERVGQFIKMNGALLDDPEHSVGTWQGPDGKIWLDVSLTTKDEDFARYAGQKFNQVAIYNPAQGEIPTGGSGEGMEHLSAPADRLRLLRKEWELQRPSGELLPKTLLYKGEQQNVRDVEALIPDRPLTKTELAASNLGRDVVRKQIQLLPSIDDRVRVRRALQQGVPEVVEYLKRQAANPKFESGLNWYRKDIEKMEETTRALFPETADPTKMTLFKALLAIFSSGATPKENYRLAAEAFATYLKTGEVPATSAFRITEDAEKSQSEKKLKVYKPATLGRTATATTRNINELIHALGGEKQFVDYLLAKHEETRGGNKDAYGALDLGPKLGRFFLNIMGKGEEVTLDLWASRTWNRWLGTPFRKQGDSYVMPDAPVNDAERNLMIEAFREIASTVSKEIGQPVDPMDIQAVLWFYEKDLYGSEGVRTDRGLFGSAAKEYAKKPLHLEKAPVNLEAERKQRDIRAGQTVLNL